MDINQHHDTRRQIKNGADYPAIRAWGVKLGSMQYYIDGEVERARRDNAPQDVIHRRLNTAGKTIGWARIKDIKDLNKRADMQIFLDIQDQLS